MRNVETMARMALLRSPLPTITHSPLTIHDSRFTEVPMIDTYHAIKITDHVFWVGAVDWTLREFHGYQTSRGTSYNAFLIVSDKVVLIDTVKKPFKDEMFSRIASVVPLDKIDVIVSNHTEMDHSGCLPELLREAPAARVVASPNGARDLKEHFQFDREITPVGDGEALDVGGGPGGVRLKFIHSPMLHWPDSMVTWYEQDGILFSQDAFGMHLASSERYDDEIGEDILLCEASKYFANILLPFSPLITRFHEKLGKMNLPVKLLAPDHGPLWRKRIGWILDLYGKWAGQKPSRKAVIVYDTMWQSTAMMASAIEDGLLSSGVAVKRMPLSACHRSDVATELLGAGALVVGSPTLNNMIFPTVADVLAYLTGLKPRNLVGAAFGSYGWNGLAVKQIVKALEEMKIPVVHSGVSVKYVPDNDDLKQCAALGARVAEAISA